MMIASRMLLLLTLSLSSMLAQAIPVPAGWDLEYKAQRAEDPEPRNPYETLYKSTDKFRWRVEYMLERVPLDSLDAAVLVQEKEWSSRFGIFVKGDLAYLAWTERESFNYRMVQAADARRLIQQYSQHSGPSRSGQSVYSDCSPNVATAAISVYQDGKASQYWISGADQCEVHTDPMGPLKVLLCAEHCNFNKVEDRWATLLRKQALALPAIANPAQAVQSYIATACGQPPPPDIVAAVQAGGLLDNGSGLLRSALESERTYCTVGWLLKSGADPDARDLYEYRAGGVATDVAAGKLRDPKRVAIALAQQDAADILRRGPSPLGACRMVNRLLKLSSPTNNYARYKYGEMDPAMQASLLALVEKLEPDCTFIDQSAPHSMLSGLQENGAPDQVLAATRQRVAQNK